MGGRIVFVPEEQKLAFTKVQNDLLNEELAKVTKKDQELALHHECIKAANVAQKLLWTWCWNDEKLLKQIVRKFGTLKVCMQVLMGSGFMQLMNVRAESFFNMLTL